MKIVNTVFYLCACVHVTLQNVIREESQNLIFKYKKLKSKLSWKLLPSELVAQAPVVPERTTEKLTAGMFERCLWCIGPNSGHFLSPINSVSFQLAVTSRFGQGRDGLDCT